MAGFALTALSLQAALIFDDFQNDTVGQDPAGINGKVEAYKVEVVDSGSTPADPFGGSTNKSLVIEGTDDAHWNSATTITTGIARFSTKLLMSTNSPYDGTAYMALMGGSNANGSGYYPTETAAHLYIRHNDIVVYNGGDTVTIDNDFNNLDLGEVWNIVIDMDVVNQTYSFKINDILMTDSVLGSTFNFRNNITAINAVGFNGADSSQQVFVDDVSLEAVPEPATIGMIGLGGLVALVMRRSRA